MKKIEWIIEKPIGDIFIEFYDYNGNKVSYGQHEPWLFQVFGEGIPTKKVVKVELPPLDYLHNLKDNICPNVKIYCVDFVEDEEK
jgi:hypothetical protein